MPYLTTKIIQSPCIAMVKKIFNLFQLFADKYLMHTTYRENTKVFQKVADRYNI